LGRTGKFWAHEYYAGCKPDILTTAKALANGVPIGAAIAQNDIAEAIKIGDHGTTFGGNPMATRVGIYCAERLGSPELLDHVSRTGSFLVSRLRSLQQKYPRSVTDVRGKGLLVGAQLSFDPAKLIGECRERGLLVISAGKNTLRVVPPLVIEEDLIDQGVSIIEDALKAVN
jgi:acetylornithine aminotransferase